MVKLITRKQPEIILKEESSLTTRHWLIIHNICKMKQYAIFICRFLNRATEKLFDELNELTDKETDRAVLIAWSDWRNEVLKLELKEQALAVWKNAIEDTTLGNMKITQIKQLYIYIRKFYSEMVEKGLAANTIKLYYNPINPALELAVDSDIIR